MGFKFTENDFNFVYDNDIRCGIVNKANAELDAHLKTLPVVYGFGYGNPLDSKWSTETLIGTSPSYIGDCPKRTTHRAILWDVQEIEKECKHAVTHAMWASDDRVYIANCDKCGAKMKPSTWEPANE